MGVNQYSVLQIIAAIIPAVWLFLAIAFLKLPSYISGLSTLVLTAFSAYFIFDMKGARLAEAILEGTAIAFFPIIWVIVNALFLYNITVRTGAMNSIREMLAGISADRRVQCIVLAFCFGGFLEAVAGFGTAVAIPAAIMTAIGFKPLKASVVCLLANTIPVAFGVLGVPIIALSQTTSLQLEKLTLYTALQLIPLSVFLPLVLVVVLTGTVKALRGITGFCMAAGTAFAAGQTAVAIFIGPELAVIGGSAFAFVVSLLWIKLVKIKNIWQFEIEDETQEKDKINAEGKYRINAMVTVEKNKEMNILTAWLPYILILVIILTVRFLPFLAFLNEYPFVQKMSIYKGSGSKPVTFAFAASGGTALLLAGIFGGLVQGASLIEIIKEFAGTVKKLFKTIATIISIISFARLMSLCGMSSAAASLIAAATGKLFPFFSPFAGALGTFLTGSDTSSNVLFGGMQKQTAVSLSLNQEWLASANAAGATAGKMVSPQSISIAAVSVGLKGKESEILRKTVLFCIAYVVLLGLIVYAGVYLNLL